MSVADYGAEISRGWRSEMGIACRHLGGYEAFRTSAHRYSIDGRTYQEGSII